MPALDIFLRDDLVQIGLTEDGEADLARCFYVVARAPNGAQWTHDFARTASRLDEDKALAAMERLRDMIAAHVAGGGKLAEEHWVEIDPAYGSAAYQSLDAHGYFLAKERQRDRDNGEHVPTDLRLDAGIHEELEGLPA